MIIYSSPIREGLKLYWKRKHRETAFDCLDSIQLSHVLISFFSYRIWKTAICFDKGFNSGKSKQICLDATNSICNTFIIDVLEMYFRSALCSHNVDVLRQMRWNKKLLARNELASMSLSRYYDRRLSMKLVLKT